MHMRTTQLLGTMLFLQISFVCGFVTLKAGKWIDIFRDTA